MERRNILLTGVILTILVSSLLLAAAFLILPEAQEANSASYVGVQLGYGDVNDCKALVDKVRNYTNLFVISSSTILQSEAYLKESCDYIAENGLSFIVYFASIGATYEYSPVVWTLKAKEMYGEQFLGIYHYDEPGGKQLDAVSGSGVTRPVYIYNEEQMNYGQVASDFARSLSEQGMFGQLDDYAYLCNYTDSSVVTSDYGLYWFDYKAGYHTVLAEFGWNHSRPLQVAMCRGAAQAQDKDWGIMITWEFSDFPYIESGAKLYDDLVFAYESGAKYTVVFNYAGDNNPNPYECGILTDEHFDALQRFWNYRQSNSEKFGSLKADVAFVLPECYGFGFRRADDTVWGFTKPDRYAQKIWEDTNNLLNQYGSRLDIVYSDPEFIDVIQKSYSTIINWESGESSANSPVVNVNTGMGYDTIQEAIASRTTYSNHTIVVKPGVYHENILIQKPLIIRGENKETTIIDGGNNGTTVMITPAGQGSTITGFTIRNGGGGAVPENSSGICLMNEANCTLAGNVVTENDFGILLSTSIGNVLKDNVMNDNSYNFGVVGLDSNDGQVNDLPQFDNDIDTSNTVNGKSIIYWVEKTDQTVPTDAGYVALINCSNIKVQDLQLHNNYNGLFLDHTHDTKLTNNVLTDNYEGIRLQNSQNNLLRNNRIEESVCGLIASNNPFNDIDASNTINNKPIYIWIGEQHKTVPSDAGYVMLINCTDITVKGLDLSNNGVGLFLSNTVNSTITFNNFVDNTYGIVLERSSGNTISQNNVTRSHYGIQLTNASIENNISQNNVTLNRDFGIVVSRCSNNTITDNYFASNNVGISITSYSEAISVLNNEITLNDLYGLLLEGSSNNFIQGNNVTVNGYKPPQYNQGSGILIHGYFDHVGSTFLQVNSTNNQIVANTISDNDRYGLTIDSNCHNTQIFYNNFNNPLQVSVQNSWDELSNNQWDDGVKGNYWSDYASVDADNNGTGDKPYIITQNGYNQVPEKDNYPLIQPFK